MCIIVYKPKGVALPATANLTECAVSNKDGIGYMFPLNDMVNIYKGFRRVDKLVRHIGRHVPDIKETPIVIHFRHGTKGKNDAGNCHPFPVCDSYEDMRRPINVCEMAMVHNGVFSVMDKNHPDVSDTMIFIAGIIHPYIEGFATEKSLLADLILGANKIALMNSAGVVYKHGEFQEFEGAFYSNGQYKITPPVDYSNHGYFGSNGYHGAYGRSTKGLCMRCVSNKVGAHEYPCNVCLDKEDRPKFAPKSCGSCLFLKTTSGHEPCRGCITARNTEKGFDYGNWVPAVGVGKCVACGGSKKRKDGSDCWVCVTSRKQEYVRLLPDATTIADDVSDILQQIGG